MTASTRPLHSTSAALAIAGGLALVLGYMIAPIRDASAEPRWLRVSWTVTGATDTTMTVAWNDTDPGGGTVAWRLLGDVTESSMPAAAFDTGSGLLDYTHEATLTGLTASTFYEYRVSSSGVWSVALDRG